MWTTLGIQFTKLIFLLLLKIMKPIQNDSKTIFMLCITTAGKITCFCTTVRCRIWNVDVWSAPCVGSVQMTLSAWFVWPLKDSTFWNPRPSVTLHARPSPRCGCINLANYIFLTELAPHWEYKFRNYLPRTSSYLDMRMYLNKTHGQFFIITYVGKYLPTYLNYLMNNDKIRTFI